MPDFEPNLRDVSQDRLHPLDHQVGDLYTVLAGASVVDQLTMTLRSLDAPAAPNRLVDRD